MPSDPAQDSRVPAVRCSLRLARRLALGLALGAGVPAAPALAQPAAVALPSLEELEAAGAVIGAIRVNAQNIFDLQDEKENNLLFRLANLLHIRTRPEVIERQLLFKTGERVSARTIEETERLLRTNRYLYDVRIRPTAYRDGVVDLEVTTRDTWSLAPGVSASRAGGANTRKATLQEFNLLGTGIHIGATRASDQDRSSLETRVRDDHAFGGWTGIEFAQARMSDGERQAFSIGRPFYALDTRWAAGIGASKDDRIDSLYGGGEIVGAYRHRRDAAELYGGWSEGVVAGWTQRYSLGVTYSDDTYAIEPGQVVPARLPLDARISAPFLRHEVIEDDYRKTKNRDQIERVEYLPLGFHSRVQLGRALRGLGATRPLWLYDAELSDGFAFFAHYELLTAFALSGRNGDGGIEQQRASASLRLYRRQSDQGLFYVSISGDALRDVTGTEQLLLGGDNGLRGYPLRYQAGDRRALLTLEQRGYSDLYLFRLFRIGGAVFYDAGRAWGGPSQNVSNAGWMSDAGFGLRILSARTAFGNILHADFAFPLHRDPQLPRFQFLIMSKTSF